MRCVHPGKLGTLLPSVVLLINQDLFCAGPMNGNSLFETVEQNSPWLVWKGELQQRAWFPTDLKNPG